MVHQTYIGLIFNCNLQVITHPMGITHTQNYSGRQFKIQYYQLENTQSRACYLQNGWASNGNYGMRSSLKLMVFGMEVHSLNKFNDHGMMDQNKVTDWEEDSV